jgi:hypothetical protein
MNPTILRRALWVVAILALAYATFAFWSWRPIELIIAAGVFVICIPIDIALHHEERSRRSPSPFGPVQKWGISEDALAEHQQRRHIHVSISEPRRAWLRLWWWRRLWYRATPWWTFIALLAVVPAAVALAPRAAADPIQDAAYLSTLDVFGVHYTSESLMIALGHSVCDSLNQGIPPNRITRAVMQGGDFNRDDAMTVFGAAIGAYCDDYVTASQPASNGIGTHLGAAMGGVLR